MTRTMLITSGLARNFWAEALNTSYYIINRCMIRPILNKTPYELLKGRKLNIMHLRVFGCKCFVHNNGKDALGKFDPKSDEVIFLVTPHTVRHTKCSISEPCVLRRVCMCYLMKLTL